MKKIMIIIALFCMPACMQGSSESIERLARIERLVTQERVLEVVFAGALLASVYLLYETLNRPLHRSYPLSTAVADFNRIMLTHQQQQPIALTRLQNHSICLKKLNPRRGA